ncbi:LCP family protein [Paenibacillus sp. GCM10023252]|uniref:LCP family protein n=1 Tax=Paenibacillus sp. GCM10023252 TaxID=3252649 RepID=UPI00360B4EE3
MPKKIKWLTILSAIILLTGFLGYFNREALAMRGFDWLLSGHVEKELEKSFKPLEGREPLQLGDQYKNADPFSLLLLGVDQRDQERGRSDTMIYTVVRPKDGAILMVSIPRDTYVDIAGRDRSDKITHAYAFGGAKMALETVEGLFDRPIQHYASINFQGFRDVIDAMGGISLPIEEDLVNDDTDHEKFVVPAGQDLYNGTDALNYVRYREDAGGDMNRTGRHQVFLNAMLDRASSVGQWAKIPGLMETMGNNFTTDMPPSMIVGLAQSFLQQNTRIIHSHTLQGEGRRKHSGGAWYYFAKEEDLEKTKALIDSWMDGEIQQEALPLPDEDSAAE